MALILTQLAIYRRHLGQKSDMLPRLRHIHVRLRIRNEFWLLWRPRWTALWASNQVINWYHWGNPPSRLRSTPDDVLNRCSALPAKTVLFFHVFFYSILEAGWPPLNACFRDHSCKAPWVSADQITHQKTNADQPDLNWSLFRGLVEITPKPKTQRGLQRFGTPMVPVSLTR